MKMYLSGCDWRVLNAWTVWNVFTKTLQAFYILQPLPDKYVFIYNHLTVDLSFWKRQLTRKLAHVLHRHINLAFFLTACMLYVVTRQCLQTTIFEDKESRIGQSNRFCPLTCRLTPLHRQTRSAHDSKYSVIFLLLFTCKCRLLQSRSKIGKNTLNFKKKKKKKR